MAGKREHGASPKHIARPVTVDSLPTMAELWAMLRRAYGTRLVGATLVAVIDNDGHVTVHTTTFPKQ